MAHRKKNAPRRGSLAYIPRSRVETVVPRIRFWPSNQAEKPTLLALPCFKAGTIHTMTVDDREKTPNFGKPLFNASTVLVTPPVFFYGFRAYGRNPQGEFAFGDVYHSSLPKDMERKMNVKPPPLEKSIARLEKIKSQIVRLTGFAYIRPRDVGLEQKKPFIFEVGVGGGDTGTQIAYLKEILGKEVRFGDVFKPGTYVDVAAVTKGKGFEGVVTRFGVKRKPHKSRKSVRAVGALMAWHPAAVTYTVPRPGQHGFHQRIEFNKRIIAVANAAQTPVTPPGGFLHFGEVKGEYTILRGSVPGTASRLVVVRAAARPPTLKPQPPQILAVSTTPGR